MPPKPDLVHGLDFADDAFRQQADFLRSGADYNTWIISTSDASARLLHSFEHWRTWRGSIFASLSRKYSSTWAWCAQGKPSTVRRPVFQVSPGFSGLLSPDGSLELPEEAQPVLVGRDGKLEMTPLVPRIARYQLARFAEWHTLQADRYVFQLTPASLQAAGEQGLELKHLRALLRKYGKPGIHPRCKGSRPVGKERLEARMEPLMVLRLTEPSLLEKLRESKASSCLGEVLGPAAVLVKPGCEGRVRAALHDLGILTDIPGRERMTPNNPGF